MTLYLAFVLYCPALTVPFIDVYVLEREMACVVIVRPVGHWQIGRWHESGYLPVDFVLHNAHDGSTTTVREALRPSLPPGGALLIFTGAWLALSSSHQNSNSGNRWQDCNFRRRRSSTSTRTRTRTSSTRTSSTRTRTSSTSTSGERICFENLSFRILPT